MSDRDRPGPDTLLPGLILVDDTIPPTELEPAQPPRGVHPTPEPRPQPAPGPKPASGPGKAAD